MKTSTLHIPPPPPVPAILAWSGSGWTWVRTAQDGSVLTSVPGYAPRFSEPVAAAGPGGGLAFELVHHAAFWR